MADATTLDASTDQKTGADSNDGTLLDAGKATDQAKDGQADAKAPPTTPDKTTDAASAKDGDQKADDKADVKPSAPEKYADPKLPEGMVIDPAVKAKFDADAKAMNLSQDQYQTLIDRHAELTTAHMQKTMDQFKSTVDGWKQESVKELGANFEKELATASKAIDRVFSDPAKNAEFREMMKNTGLGNWAPMIRLCTFVGKALSEDKFIDGRPDSKEARSQAERLFPEMAASK